MIPCSPKPCQVPFNSWELTYFHPLIVIVIGLRFLCVSFHFRTNGLTGSIFTTLYPATSRAAIHFSATTIAPLRLYLLSTRKLLSPTSSITHSVLIFPPYQR